MPHFDTFEDISKKVAAGSGDVIRGLDGIVGAAEEADAAYKKLTKTQESALQISEKFEKALTSSTKALLLFGHSSVTASRGLKTIDAVSKSAAASLTSIGVGATSATAGWAAGASTAVSTSSTTTL